MPLNLLSKEALLKGLSTILVPTDLSEHSRRALLYGCWLAADDKASLLVLHVANELNAWEYQTDELALVELRGKTWPVDRVLSEGNLDLVRFLEPSLGADLQFARFDRRLQAVRVDGRIPRSRGIQPGVYRSGKKEMAATFLSRFVLMKKSSSFSFLQTGM
jgi:nucleotide-binding universal stress UspA family protein